MNYIQSAHGSGPNIAFPSTPKQFSLLVALVYGPLPASIPSFSCGDTTGNRYLSSPLRSGLNPSPAASQVFFAVNQAEIANMVQFGVVNTTITQVAIHEFSLVNAFDAACFGVGIGNSQDSGLITTNFVQELLFGYEVAITGQSGVSPGPGWTTMETLANQFLTQYRIVTAKGSYNSISSTTAVKSGTVSWIEEILSFYDANFEVGQLYPNNIGYPPAKQPGGQGTPVTDPKQQIGPTTNTKPDLLFPINEFSGRFRPGCGHSINSYEVSKSAVNGIPSALIMCPICKYVVHILTPYDLIHTDQYAYIIG